MGKRSFGSLFGIWLYGTHRRNRVHFGDCHAFGARCGEDRGGVDVNKKIDFANDAMKNAVAYKRHERKLSRVGMGERLCHDRQSYGGLPERLVSSDCCRIKYVVPSKSHGERRTRSGRRNENREQGILVV